MEQKKLGKKSIYLQSTHFQQTHKNTHTHIEERRVSSINGAMETGYPYAKE
jgi:hypothetical protein